MGGSRRTTMVLLAGAAAVAAALAVGAFWWTAGGQRGLHRASDEANAFPWAEAEPPAPLPPAPAGTPGPLPDRILVRVEVAPGVADGETQVVAVPSGGGGRPRLATAGPAGLFVLDGLEESGRYDLAARREGCFSDHRRDVAPGGPPVTIHLRPFVRVLGVVTDDDGFPFEGVRVRLYLDRGGPSATPPGPEVEAARDRATGRDGSYELEQLPTRSGWLIVETPAGARVERRVDIAEDAYEARIDLTMPAGQRISGRVVDPDGKGVKGCWLSLVHGNTTQAMGETEEDGRFRVRPRIEVPFSLEVTAPQRSGLLDLQRDGLGGKHDDVVLTLQRDPAPGCWLDAFLVDHAGTPVASMDVTVEDVARAAVVRRTHGGLRPPGILQLGSVPPGTYRLLIRSPEGCATVGPITLSQTGITDLGRVVLAPPGRVAGRVVDASGAPVARVRIEIGPHRTPAEAETAEDGSFRVGGLPEGETPLRFLHPAHDTALRTVRLGAGAEVTLPPVVLDAASGTVRGRVLFAKGRRAPGVSIRLRTRSVDGDREHRFERHLAVAADGTFSADGIPAETYETLAVLSQSYETGARDTSGYMGPYIEVLPRGVAEFEIDLRSRGQ